MTLNDADKKPPFTCPTEKAVFILYNNLRKRFFISYKKPLEAIKNLLRL